MARNLTIVLGIVGLLTSGTSALAVEGIWDSNFASYAPPVVPGDVQEWQGKLYVGTGSYSDVIEARPWLAVWDGFEWSHLDGFLDGLYEPDEYGYLPAATGWRLDVHGDEMLVAANIFGIHRTNLCRVASWNGSRWRVYGGALEGNLWALGVAGDDVFVVVNQVIEGSQYTDRVYHWNGQEWEALNETGDLERFLWTDAGAIHVVGELRSLGGEELAGILRWDGSRWMSVAPAPADWVRSLVRWRGRLLAGTATGDSLEDLLFQWDGTKWEAFESPLISRSEPLYWEFGIVSSLRIDGDALHATGSFRTADSADTWLHYAAYDGHSWLASSGTALDDYAQGVETWRGRRLVYGAFNVANGRSVSGLAQMGPGGWEGIRRSSAIRGTVENFRVRNDGLWVLGSIRDAGGEPMSSPAVWDGSRWSARVEPNWQFQIRDVVEHQGQLYATGSFRYDVGDSVEVSPLAVQDGESWVPIRAEWGEFTRGESMVSWGDAIALSGRVWPREGLLFGRVAIWNGTSVEFLDTGERGAIHALEVYDGRLFVGGNFFRLNGATVLMVGAYDGTTVHPVAGGVGGEVVTFEHFGDDLVVGGHFVTVGGTVPARAVAVWNGTQWSALGDGFESDRKRVYGRRVATVVDLVIHEGELYATGWFDRSGEVAVNNLARWDGSVWRPLGGGVGNPAYVDDEGHKLASFEGSLYVAGDFKVAGNVSASGFARWIEFSETARQRGIELVSIAPNPMNPRTRVSFTLAQSGPVGIDLYDTRGRHVRRLLDGSLDPGEYVAIWDGTDSAGRAVASGVYLVRVHTTRADEHGKVTLLR